MIFPVLIQRIFWPAMDWSMALGIAMGHALLGALRAKPQVHDKPDPQ